MTSFHMECKIGSKANLPCRVGLVVSMSASHTVGREFDSRPGHTKDSHKKMVQTSSLHGMQCARVRVWQCSPTV